MVLLDAAVNLFSRIAGARGGSRKLGAGIRTSIVSVLALRVGGGRKMELATLVVSEFGVLLVRRAECIRLGVCRGVVYGSRSAPARTAGAGGAGVNPKLSFGVRSHMLFIRGVGVDPVMGFHPTLLALFCTTVNVELGDAWAEREPRRIKSVRAACWGS